MAWEGICKRNEELKSQDVIIYADIKWDRGLTYIEGWTKDGREKVNIITRSKITSMTDAKDVLGDWDGVY